MTTHGIRIDSIVGSYRVVKQIGAGGMGNGPGPELESYEVTAVSETWPITSTADRLRWTPAMPPLPPVSRHVSGEILRA